MAHIAFIAGTKYNVRCRGKIISTIECLTTPKAGTATFAGTKRSKLYSASSGLVDGVQQPASEYFVFKLGAHPAGYDDLEVHAWDVV